MGNILSYRIYDLTELLLCGSESDVQYFIDMRFRTTGIKDKFYIRES